MEKKIRPESFKEKTSGPIDLNKQVEKKETENNAQEEIDSDENIMDFLIYSSRMQAKIKAKKIDSENPEDDISKKPNLPF